MPELHSRLGTWDLPNVHAWADRAMVIRASAEPIVGPETRVATIGSCFASELAAMMGTVGIRGAIDPFRDYDTIYPDRAALETARAAADAAADAVFRGADVVVVTLGLIEAWRSPTTG